MLTVVTREEARNIILEHCKELRNRTVYRMPELHASSDLYSPEDLPDHSRSTVDGFAVRAGDTWGCSEALPAMLRYGGRILMGEMPQKALGPGECMEIPTGGYLPSGADAVCMLEYAEQDIGDGFRYLLKSLSVSENVNRQGDDCHQGDLLVKAGTRITSRNIAVLAAVGLKEASEMLAKLTGSPAGRAANAASLPDGSTVLKMGIISTGDELVECDRKPRPGQIRNINSVMLAMLAGESGFCPVVYPIVRDDEVLLRETLSRAAEECDCICISGGSSVGEKDHVFRVLSETGEILFHGVAVKPGKPTMFAMMQGIPVFGLPGHPAAAFFIFRLLVQPALRKMAGPDGFPDCSGEQRTVQAVLSRNLSSNHGREEIVPVRLENGKAVPIRAGSGVVSVLAGADGYLIIGRNQEGLMQGDPAEVQLFEATGSKDSDPGKP